ncbi:PD-(D/E)XK nuclease domain-containing protein, partial [Oribacterium sp. WCC10]|uniref:PD-(D/E)XK nuclease domain-containing protein n=1 Tax=Oribacterium sp. WCC10 TaxID=1855343 RepID=UPI0008E777FD
DDFDSYWTETSAAEGLMSYISKPYNGMAKTIAELIGGVDVNVDTVGFANDLVTFRGRDDVLTLMIHLGYLAYDSEKKTAHIPNEEIRLEFQRAIRNVEHEETSKRLRESDQLFIDTINMNEEAVAAQIEKIHREETSPLHYNKEDSLRSVIKLAYYTYKDNYLQWEELPSGDGYADVVYLPKHDSGLPALVIELKWNKSAEGAIEQIKQKHYPESLKGYGSELLLVGINYDKDKAPGERKHSCRIEKFEIS